MRNLKILCSVALVLGLASSAKAQFGFSTTNLVTSNSGANAATITDSGAVNSWGVSYSPTSPLWVSAEGLGVANVYTITTSNSVTKSSRIVTIPGNGSVTGQAWNGNSAAFNGDNFLFVSEDGTISGWRSSLGTLASDVFVSGNTANAYFGATEVTSGTDSYLYAANFHNNSIDVVNGTLTTPSLTGSFTDPNLPAGYAPYNVQLLGSNLFVAYALQNSSSSAAVKAAGNGVVAEFDSQGDFVATIATTGTLNPSNGTLDAPWGLAIAPRVSAPLRATCWWATSAAGRSTPITLVTIRMPASWRRPTVRRLRSMGFGH